MKCLENGMSKPNGMSKSLKQKNGKRNSPQIKITEYETNEKLKRWKVKRIRNINEMCKV